MILRRLLVSVSAFTILIATLSSGPALAEGGSAGGVVGKREKTIGGGQSEGTASGQLEKPQVKGSGENHDASGRGAARVRRRAAQPALEGPPAARYGRDPLLGVRLPDPKEIMRTMPRAPKFPE